MAFIAMKTANPLGRRPFNDVMLAGDFDFPGAPVPHRFLAGAAHKDELQPPPPVSVIPVASPWTSRVGSFMTLGDATTSTQTTVPTANTTPQLTSAVPAGVSVAQSWFSQENLIPGLSNMEVLGIAIAIVGIGAMLAGRR